jgi:bilirubin oxidase
MDIEGMKTGFLINGLAFDMKRVDVVSKVGQVELWEIVNTAGIDHAFHLHGTQFQFVETERDGTIASPPYRAWKDTVKFGPRRDAYEFCSVRSDLALACISAILKHEQLGMMGVIDVRA